MAQQTGNFPFAAPEIRQALHSLAVEFRNRHEYAKFVAA